MAGGADQLGVHYDYDEVGCYAGIGDDVGEPGAGADTGFDDDSIRHDCCCYCDDAQGLGLGLDAPHGRGEKISRRKRVFLLVVLKQNYLRIENNIRINIRFITDLSL